MELGRPFPPDSPIATQVVPSPNGRPHRPEERWDFIILHGTWMADDAAALHTLCNPQKEVSCHYFITQQAQVIQLVPESHVAWHAGKSAWQGREMLNGCALGIEISNIGPWHTVRATRENEANVTSQQWKDAVPYTPAQYTALIALLKDLMQRHSIPPQHVLGHSEVSPGRKTDPGQHFDWSILAAAGVALPRPLAT